MLWIGNRDRSGRSELQGKTSGDILEELARRGARELLARAMEAEVAEHVEKYRELVDEEGRRLVVRNGHLPTRELVTGIGALSIHNSTEMSDMPPGTRGPGAVQPANALLSTPTTTR